MLNQVLVEQILNSPLNNLARVDDQGVILLELMDVSVQTCLQHLLSEELDVADRGHHVVGDSCMECLHHVHPLPLLL